MTPNFPDGEYLLTDKVTYRFYEPKRGDVIVFETPTSTTGEEFIKRIIGLPGDSVSVQNGRIYINTQLLDEKYLTSDIITSPGAFLAEGQSVIVIKDKYLVLGDNRQHSSDSRSWGFVDKDKITGRAWLVYWPLSKAGTIIRPEYNL